MKKLTSNWPFVVLVAMLLLFGGIFFIGGIAGTGSTLWNLFRKAMIAIGTILVLILLAIFGELPLLGILLLAGAAFLVLNFGFSEGDSTGAVPGTDGLYNWMPLSQSGPDTPDNSPATPQPDGSNGNGNGNGTFSYPPGS